MKTDDVLCEIDEWVEVVWEEVIVFFSILFALMVIALERIRWFLFRND